MNYRKLRIAWSATCAIACLLLIFLWIRSYWRDDICGVTLGHEKRTGGASSEGYVVAIILDWNTLVRLIGKSREWDIRSEQQPYLYPDDPPDVRARKRQLPRFPFPSLKAHDGYYRIIMPHYSLAVLCAAFAAAPWFGWRFSVRALLLAMTLAAVLLGLAILN